MKKILLRTRIVLTNVSRLIMSFLFINLNFSLANKVFGVSLKDIDSRNTVFYAATSHLAELYCLMCACGVIISNGLLSLSIANIMLHTL